MSRHQHRRSAWAALGLLGLVACGSEGPELWRPPAAARSLGAEVFTLLCQRLAIRERPHDVAGADSRGVCRYGLPPTADLGPRLQALHTSRQLLIEAVDGAIDPSLRADLSVHLEALLAAPNQPILAAASQSLSGALASLAADPAALSALAYLDQQEGYVPPPWQANFSRAVMQHPRWPELSESMVRALTTPGEGQDRWHAFQVGLQALLRQPPTSQAAGARLLLQEHAELPEPAGLLIARRDQRGLAMAANLRGQPAAPFSDGDGDGLADTDLGGHYIDAAGNPLQLPTPLPMPRPRRQDERRDRRGRALDPDGAPLYQYRRVERTALAALLNEVYDLLRQEPDAGVALLRPLPALLAEVAQGQGGGGALLGLLQTALKQLGTPAGRDVLAVLQTLLRQEPGAVAELAAVGLTLQDWLAAPEWANATLHQAAAFHREALELWRATAAVPGLLEDLLAALGTPQMAALGEVMAMQMRYRDPIRLPANGLLNDAAEPQQPRRPVNWQADDTFANQSLMQRLLDLVDNTNRSTWCNRRLLGLPACSVFRVPNMAVYYLQTIARDPTQPGRSKAVLPSESALLARASARVEGMAWFTGIDDFTTHPEPAGLNRFLFGPRNAWVQRLVDPPRGRDGLPLETRHPDTIFAWELGGFYPAVQPLLQPYADRDQEQLAVDLFSLLHRHYRMGGTNLRQFEPLIANLIGQEGHLPASLARLIRALQQIRLGDGATARDGLQVAAAWTRQLLATPSATREQAAADLAAVAELRRNWPEASAALGRLTQRLEHALLDLDPTAATPGWRNPRTAPLLRHALASLSAELGPPETDPKRHAAAWAQGWQDAASAPWLADTAALAASLSDDAEVRLRLVDLLLDLPRAGQPHHGQESMIIALVQLFDVHGGQEILQALLRHAATALTPGSGAVDHGMLALRAAQNADPRHTVARLMRGMVQLSEHFGGLIWQQLFDVLVAVNRVQPGTEGPLSADDVGILLAYAVELLDSPNHGLQRLHDLLAHAAVD